MKKHFFKFEVKRLYYVHVICFVLKCKGNKLIFAVTTFFNNLRQSGLTDCITPQLKSFPLHSVSLNSNILFQNPSL